MGYRETIKAAVLTKSGHPLNRGVKMQAHHLVSKKGVKLSGLKADLEHLGYDINVLENLALIPCTLQGACHLGVQLHRGNHTRPADFENDDNDKDSYHGMSYHVAVSAALRGVKIRTERGDLCNDPPTKIQERIDGISTKFMGLISIFAMPLTNIHKNFLPVPKRPGCCGADLIGDADEDVACPTGRNHRGRQGPTQKPEGISHRGKPYALGVGK